jgi:hypothetical protein
MARKRASSQQESPRIATARNLRDAALTLLRKHGEWIRIPPQNIPTMSVEHAGFGILHRSPFQPIPQASDRDKYTTAVLGLRHIKYMPYGLDIWHPLKVLSVEWRADEILHVISFKRGSWEQELIRVAEEPIE